jgi:hypothetical protein
MKTPYRQKSTGPSFADAVTHFESQFLSKTRCAVPSCLILIAWPPVIAKNRYLEIVMTSSILESDGMEDDLKALNLKWRFLLALVVSFSNHLIFKLSQFQELKFVISLTRYVLLVCSGCMDEENRCRMLSRSTVFSTSTVLRYCSQFLRYCGLQDSIAFRIGSVVE